jgi:hypothetical protein
MLGLWRRDLDSSGSEQGPVAASCEHGDKSLGCLKGTWFRDQLSDCYVLKKDSGPCSYVMIKNLLLVIDSYSTDEGSLL